MSLHRNRVQMTVTGTPGTGAITLNAATTGYQSFASAYGADATVDILITEGNNWEVCRNCAYTNGTPQVDRGTLEGSSAGPTTRVSFGSGAIVSVIATAASGNNWGLNEISASPTGAGVTGVVGTLHLLNISGLTASRDFTLPATCAVGDRVGVFITTGDDAFELSLKPATGDTINGGSAGAEWSRLFITGECVIFRCITADTDWIVEYDGRIASCVTMTAASAQTGIAASTWTTVTQGATGSWTSDPNVGNLADTGNNAMKARRAGSYLATINVSVALMADQRVLLNGVLKNGSGDTRRIARGTSAAGSSTVAASGSLLFNLAAGDYLQGRLLHTDTVNRSTEFIANEQANQIMLQEIL